MTSSDLQALVAECLELIDRDGPAAVDDYCRRHPRQADAIRERVDFLIEAGLIEPRADDDAFPEQLGDFRLLERLGGGGMGVVFRARQLSLDREVALKLIRPDQMLFGRARERFRREIEVVARLQHPAIVPVYAVGEDHGVPHFAMECVPGCTLAEVISDLSATSTAALSGLDLARAVARRTNAADPGTGAPEAAWIFEGSWGDVCCRVAAQVAGALDHAHRRGVLHRDVKPSNIMLTPGGRVMLLDFGVSSLEGSATLTRSGTPLGTVAYMAPELLGGQVVEPDARSDVYALGATLYEMLCLRPPFSGRTPQALVGRVLAGNAPAPRSLGPAVTWEAETVCMTAMDRDPKRRYATAADLRRDLECVLEKRPIAARRPGAWLLVRRWAQREPAWAVGLLLGFVITVVGPVVLAVQQAAARRQIQSALSRSEDSRRRAEADFHQALGALELLAEVGNSRLSDVPGVEPIRKELLRSVLDFHEKFLAAHRDDPAVRWEVAQAYRHAGRLSTWLGEHDAARRDLDTSIALLRELAAELPERRELRLDLVRSLLGRGYSSLQAGTPAEAETALREGLELLDSEDRSIAVRGLSARGLGDLALALDRLDRPLEAAARYDAAIAELESLIRDGRSIEIHRASLASTRVALGHLHRRLGANEAARACLTGAVTGLENLVAARPGRAPWRHDLAAALDALATLAATSRGDPHEAETWYRRALPHLERLIRDHPGVARYRASLATVWSNLGIIYESLTPRRTKEGSDARGRARELLTGLLEGNPDDPEFRSKLGALEVESCNAAWTDGDPERAVEHVEAAIDHLSRVLAKNPASPSWRSHMRNACRAAGRAYLGTGCHEDAAEAAAGLSEYGDDWLSHRVAAGFFGRCIHLANADASLDAEERRRLVEEYRTAGFAELQKAFEMGYDRIEDAMTVVALEPLRRHPAFPALLERMKQR